MLIVLLVRTDWTQLVFVGDMPTDNCWRAAGVFVAEPNQGYWGRRPTFVPFVFVGVFH